MSTTIEKAVSTGGDDGYWRIGSSPAFGSADVYQILGKIAAARCNIFARWTGITIPAGSVITSAHVEWYFHSYSGTPVECALYFNDVLSTVAPTSYTGAEGKTRTTESVKYTPPSSGGWISSPELKTIIQELVDSYTYSNGSMMLLGIGVDEDGVSNYTALSTYNRGASYAPKLFISYSSLPPRRRRNHLIVR